MANPLNATGESVNEGRKLFVRDCLSCHGERGKGDGILAALIERRPGDLTAERMAQQTDGELFWKISHGRTPMPAFEEFLSTAQRWHLINYVRTLGPRPVLAMAASEPGMTADLTPTREDAPVTRREYEALLGEMAAMRAEIRALRAGQTAPPVLPSPTNRPVTGGEVLSGASTPSAPSERADTPVAITPTDARQPLESAAATTGSGTSKFLLSGFGFAEFIDRGKASSTFSAGLSPVFLWEINDRILFESELELTLTERPAEDPNDPFGLSTGSHEDGASVDLTYANLSYLLNDSVTAGAGKFLVPVGAFNERLHPAWINKLPAAPLVFDHGGGLVPHSDVGAFIRGVTPVGRSRVNYIGYLANGPSMQTTGDHAGNLDHDNFPDVNNGKAVGGRIGFLPSSRVEVGYSVQYAGVAPSGEPDVDLLLQAVDFVYQPEVSALAGMLEFRAEWVWSHLDFDGNSGSMFHKHVDHGAASMGMDHNRDGGYLQLSYRPTLAGSSVVRRIEIAGRYDRLDRGMDQYDRRWTLGLNYWLAPAVVLKGAYQITEAEEDAVMLQAVMGF